MWAPLVSADKYSFLGNVHMCQDRATVANLKSFKHPRTPSGKKLRFNVHKRAAVTVSPLSICTEKSREAKHTIL